MEELENSKESRKTKKELLSPAGNFLCLYCAIHNGCDAVYIGGKKFGARAYADNFSEEEIVKSILYCHLYGVKLYVTINTMIYESEMEECINYIRFLHQNHVDAVILEDLGLITRVRKQFPNLEIHASTQMHTHNQEQLKVLESLKIKRVVLARELSLEEIKNFQTKMEIEAFIHGALCISYSGQCLFSSLLLDRSGNRGSCAQICRLPFKLVKNQKEIPLKDEYLLSTKELSTLDNFEEIMKSNIYSLKIEGRMKSPSYVAYTTRLYRILMDKYERNEPLILKEEEKKQLKVLYNREFTKGHLFNAKNEELMNGKKPNHQGIILGKVLEITKGKIKILLEEDLHQNDGIRFFKADKGFFVNFLYNEKGLLISSAKKGEKILVDNKINLKIKDRVLKTVDSVFEQDLQKPKEKTIPIIGKVRAHLNQPLKITFLDNENKVEKEMYTIKEAKNSPTSKEILKEKLSATHNSPFLLTDLEIDMDENIFIPMSILKEMKHELINTLMKKRQEKTNSLFVEKEWNPKKKEPKKVQMNEKKIHVLVQNETQLQACLKYPVSSIYVTNPFLYQKYKKDKRVYLKFLNVKSTFKPLKQERLLVGDTGSLFYYGKTNTCVTDYFLNVSNHDTFNYLSYLNAKRITLSIENKKDQIALLMKEIEEPEKVELYIYGKPQVMLMKYCPINRYLNKEKNCFLCKEKDFYYLKDRENNLYRMLLNPLENHLTQLFYHKNLNFISDIPYYQNLGICNFRLEFLEETAIDVESILCKIFECKI